MKKVILFSLLCLFTTFTASAQWKITPEAGVSIFKEKGIFDAGVGARIGVGVRYSFNGDDDGWGLVSGLYYLQRKAQSFNGGELTGKVPGFNETAYVTVVPGYIAEPIPVNMQIEGGRFSRITTRRDYLQLPVMIQYAWYLTPDIRYHLAAGPYIAVGIGGKNKIESTEWNKSNQLKLEEYSNNPFSLLRYDRFDAGASVQTGLDVQNIAILLNYSLNLYKRDSTGKEHLFSIGIGYTF